VVDINQATRKLLDSPEIYRLDYNLCSGKEPVLLFQMRRNKAGLERAV